MKPDRWGKVKEVFRGAMDRPAPDRDEYIRVACAGDGAVQAEVERLLALDVGDAFLQTPVVEQVTAGADALVGRRVGRFLLKRHLASGGMGAVYEADQENPSRTVAVKVLRPAFASGSSWRRFSHEAQILGRLQHPGIAQIFEAGTFDFGAGAQPYFAMELIEGSPLDEYARAERLTTPQRLELMVKICDAVHHAHQKGVIHRDLKPGNILVDRTGQPKILDFGVARATDVDLQATTMHTSAGELVGTINYMSPEQVSGDPDRLDIRSDVYTLGVIGYELLSGRLPYDLDGKSIPDALRTIEDSDPVPLGSTHRVFRGDLATLFAKAIEKEESRRYQSAAALAADIRRHLDDEPIVARSPTTLYQLRKFARRNRALVSGIAATFLALVFGLVLTSVQARRAGLAAARYQYEADKATAVTNYITNDLVMNLLHGVGEIAGEQGVPLEQMLDRATANVGTLFADQPLGEAAVRNELGTMYYNIGHARESEAQFARALEIWEGALGPDHTDTLKAVNNMAQAIGKQGRTDEAARLFRRALEGRLRLLGEDNRYTLATMNNLAVMLEYQGTLDEAQSMLQRTLEIQRRVHGPRHKHPLTTTVNLGRVVRKRGDHARAEQLHRRAVAEAHSTLGPGHVATLNAMTELGETLRVRGKLDEAEPVLRRVAGELVRTLGPEHPDTVKAQSALGGVLADLGRYADAEAVLLECHAAQHAALGEDHRRTRRTADRLATLYDLWGKPDDAAMWRAGRPESEGTP